MKLSKKQTVPKSMRLDFEASKRLDLLSSYTDRTINELINIAISELIEDNTDLLYKDFIKQTDTALFDVVLNWVKRHVANESIDFMLYEIIQDNEIFGPDIETQIASQDADKNQWEHPLKYMGTGSTHQLLIILWIPLHRIF